MISDPLWIGKTKVPQTINQWNWKNFKWRATTTKKLEEKYKIALYKLSEDLFFKLRFEEKHATENDLQTNEIIQRVILSTDLRLEKKKRRRERKKQNSDTFNKRLQVDR